MTEVTHEYYYVGNGVISTMNQSGYRGGGLITSVQIKPNKNNRKSFQAVQSLIIPERIDADEIFKYSK